MASTLTTMSSVGSVAATCSRATTDKKLSSFSQISTMSFGGKRQNLQRRCSPKIRAAKELYFNKDGSAIKKLQNGVNKLSDLVNISQSESLKYTLISELDIEAPADDVWALIASKDANKTFQMLLPGVFEKLEIIQGDGGVGTTLLVVYPPGSVPLSNEEKFVTIDDRTLLKEILQTKGGYLDMGVTFYMESFQIFPKGHNSCVFKSMVRYEVPDKLAPNVSSLISVEGLLSMAKAAAKYVVDSKKKSSNY